MAIRPNPANIVQVADSGTEFEAVKLKSSYTNPPKSTAG